MAGEQSSKSRIRQVYTTGQLRARIDRGDTGDKVRVSDPAASPLGTDDEAAGTPNTRAQVQTAARTELHRNLGGGSEDELDYRDAESRKFRAGGNALRAGIAGGVLAAAITAILIALGMLS